MWLAKNNPEWDKYMKEFENLQPDPEAPDPEFEAAKNGDLEALLASLETWFVLVSEMEFRLGVLMREISSLKFAMEQKNAARNSDSSTP